MMQAEARLIEDLDELRTWATAIGGRYGPATSAVMPSRSRPSIFPCQLPAVRRPAPPLRGRRGRTPPGGDETPAGGRSAARPAADADRGDARAARPGDR